MCDICALKGADLCLRLHRDRNEVQTQIAEHSPPTPAWREKERLDQIERWQRWGIAIPVPLAPHCEIEAPNERTWKRVMKFAPVPGSQQRKIPPIVLQENYY